MTITRIGTANMYDRTTLNISRQQAELASQMEHASAGKKVIRASDDPVAAAQAERARTRLQRIETDQRTLDAQTASIQYAEATLGEINSAVQEFRGLLVQAGNGTYNQVQRDTLYEQLTSLSEQILKYSNRTDSNGLPLFRGLDAKADKVFPNGTQAMQAGQTNASEYAITNALDGALAFLSGSTGNGVLAITRPVVTEPINETTGLGNSWADVGSITDPDKASALGLNASVSISFNDAPDGILRYTIQGGSNDGETGVYETGKAINVQGMNVVITGDPKHVVDPDDPNSPIFFDSYEITNSQPQSLFDTLKKAIDTVKNNGNLDGSTDHGALAHGIAKSLAEIDTALNRVSTVRGMAGDLLTQAERMGTTLLARSEQMEAQRSSAEDIDMVAALSQLKTQETAVSAALQSYASIQKLSLFNYIN